MTEQTAGETAAAADAVIAELTALPLRVLVERLCGLEATLVAGGAISTALRTAARDKMVERWREDQVAPTGRAAGLGTVSLSVPQQKLVVDDDEAFASWLVQRHPSEVEATITLRVPSALLPDVLEAIDTELLSPDILAELDGPMPADSTPADAAVRALAIAFRDREVKLTPRPAFTKPLLESGLTVIPGGVGADGEAYAAAVFDEEGSVVEGVIVVPGADPAAVDGDGKPVGPQPTSISVRLEAEAKARAVAAAAAQFRGLLAGQPAVLAVDGSLAGGNQGGAELLEGGQAPGTGTWLEGPPEEALAEPSYDDEPAECGEPGATCAHPPGYFDDEAIPDDAPAIDVLGLAAWRSMRKPALQAECRRLRLDDSGTVAELKGRLGDWAASTAGMPA